MGSSELRTTPNQRLDAIMCALRTQTAVDVAKTLGVLRPRLVEAQNGLYPVTEELAQLIEAEYYVSSPWLLGGEPPVLVADAPYEDGKRIAETIMMQCRIGGVRSWSLPTFGSVGAINESELARGGSRGAKGRKSRRIDWWPVPRRAVAPTSAVREQGYYVVAGRDAEAFGCSADDYVLVLPTEPFFRSHNYREGVVLACIVRSKGTLRVGRYALVATVTDYQLRYRTGFLAPEKDKYDLVHSTMPRSTSKRNERTRYYLKAIAPTKKGKDIEIVGVAVSAERDLIRAAVK